MIEVLNIENIKIPSINRKYNVNKAGQFFLTKQYREFKDVVKLCLVKTKLNPPYFIRIDAEMYIDIDNPAKVILDAMEDVGIIDNDKNVVRLDTWKTPVKRNADNKLRVSVEGEYDNAL